jgi:hypothetical protein
LFEPLHFLLPHHSRSSNSIHWQRFGIANTLKLIANIFTYPSTSSSQQIKSFSVRLHLKKFCFASYLNCWRVARVPFSKM